MANRDLGHFLEQRSELNLFERQVSIALDDALGQAIDVLVPGGRAVVLSYHSGEDRIVKRRFRDAASGNCICPPGMPCVCGAQPTVRLLGRSAKRPTADEVARNRRAESARLRAVERLPEPEGDDAA